MSAPAEPMEVVERVLQILQHGSTASTYKHAVLLALIDVCAQRANENGMPPSSVTTRQLAERVVELYWGQTRTWPDPKLTMLQQNTQSGRSIPHMVCELRSEVEGQAERSISASRARVLTPARWEDLVREVEWRLIDMPLPRLQEVEKVSHQWLYVLAWNHEDRRPRRAAVSAYQKGRASDFDNAVRLLPGVPEALSRLHILLRPFVQQRWVEEVAGINGLPESKLHDFLFGSQRIALDPVRAPLSELQSGRCFYCRKALGTHAHVDHFLPWARYGEDGLANLVVADEACNGDKSDRLPARDLVLSWRTRNKSIESDLAKVAPGLSWELGVDRSLGLARAVYRHLPGGSLLWGGPKALVPYDRDELLRALA